MVAMKALIPSAGERGDATDIVDQESSRQDVRQDRHQYRIGVKLDFEQGTAKLQWKVEATLANCHVRTQVGPTQRRVLPLILLPNGIYEFRLEKPVNDEAALTGEFLDEQGISPLLLHH